MKKRGISNVVAVVLMILITVFGVTIVWTVLIPIIKDNMFYGDFDVQLSVGEEGYTVYDPSQNLALVQIKRGNDDERMVGVEIIFSVNGSSHKVIVEPPGANGGRTYKIPFGDVGLLGIPDSVRVAPIFRIGDRERVGRASYKAKISKGRIGSNFDAYECPLGDDCREGRGRCLNVGDKRFCGETNEGECEYGTQTCGNDGGWGLCIGEVSSETEICDGLDNDCDGSTDEGCPCGVVGTIQQCGSDVGECNFGEQVCGAGGWGVCGGVGYIPSSGEICDGLDNDCDGTSDNNLKNIPACGDYGVCASQFKVCGGVLGWLACDLNLIPDYEATEVSCDGSDNDCDNSVDEPFNVGDDCLVGDGACVRGGSFVCLGDGSGIECDGIPGTPSAEVCDDIGLVDEDCDGYSNCWDIDSCSSHSSCVVAVPLDYDYHWDFDSTSQYAVVELPCFDEETNDFEMRLYYGNIYLENPIGRVNNCVKFSSSQFTSLDHWNFYGGTYDPLSFTFSFWINSAASSGDLIVADDSDDYWEPIRLISLNGGKIEASADGYNFVSSVSSFNTGEWEMVTITFDGSVLKIYKNGVTIPDNSGSSNPFDVSSWKLIIGKDYDDISPMQGGRGYYGGMMDELKIWSRSLSGEEVKALYNSY